MTPNSIPRPGLLRWTLIVSLGLNIAVLGLVIGAILIGPPDHRDSFAPGLTNFRAIPEPYRSNLSSEMRRGRHDWSARRDALREQREALAATLTAEPFEIESFAAVLDQERALVADISRRGSELLLEQVRMMSAGDRAAYAEAILNPRRAPHDRPRR